ncbi:cell wall-associated NlpC family hydrolase [Flavobacterium cutihirudinis]|uniref:Cell wall-associated NlpC family hydrolase n=1 Tax=Flavobacterium cutihirudinis TaxID=1265740 RepID=A0A3D9FP39_9FLAO|nr:peptidoglycan endopeptidase [Flavobacterium cutihirudinis]RED22186.1 cell wall-associated NlpC family hydrolase [Flavobacterium cutihirudinis]
MVCRLIIVLFFFSVGVFSQEKYTKHKISKGENITVIAKRYGVKPKDIINANPNAPKVLKLNSILLIPNNDKAVAVKSTEKAEDQNPGFHEVQVKETLWAISKKHNITVEELKKANPSLETDDLKIGQQLTIPLKNEISISDNTIKKEETSKPEIVPSTDVEVIVEVQPKETKYAIAKKYGITVAQLEKQNPFIKGKLPVGYVLKIKTSKEKADAATSLNSTQNTNEIKPLNEENIQVADNTNVKTDSTLVRISNQSELINQLILNATGNIGTRYRSGGTTKSGFDCSGLMFCTFGNFDIKLPRSSIEQSRIGVKVDSDAAQKGDLIFFKTNGRRHINHVGMIVEVTEGEIKFVHSSTHGGVMISSTKEPYYERAFSQVNRILEQEIKKL